MFFLCKRERKITEEFFSRKNDYSNLLPCRIQYLIYVYHIAYWRCNLTTVCSRDIVWIYLRENALTRNRLTFIDKLRTQNCSARRFRDFFCIFLVSKRVLTHYHAVMTVSMFYNLIGRFVIIIIMIIIIQIWLRQRWR